ncbi:uncharacterized protein LOC132280843 [Cornus florida]|uniref:uncharacterized protein LOC132280843 n=1 Tax=Cornus florida TaxID=4283 RepID=UPI002896F599|nr:uncharacterized protein LOC132280843 [Cornus florida]
MAPKTSSKHTRSSEGHPRILLRQIGLNGPLKLGPNLLSKTASKKIQKRSGRSKKPEVIKTTIDGAVFEFTIHDLATALECPLVSPVNELDQPLYDNSPAELRLYEIVEEICHNMYIGFGAGKVPKTEAKWNTEDYKLISLNAKAKVNLNCAISPCEYNRISTCTTAKEIWDKLQITYEGTSQHLGRTITNSDLARKILRSLPKKWDAKANAIKEAHNLNTLELEELLGSLLTWEITLKDREGDHHRKKEIALKVSQMEKEVSGNENENDDLALITQSFKRFIHRKEFNKGRFKKGESSNEQGKRDSPTYFHCGKPGHFKADYHAYKEEKKKKRAMQATWEDDDSNGSESDEEKAIFYLMASRDEVNSNSDSSSKNVIAYADLVDAYNGLLDSFKELHDELGKMVNKCASRRKEKLIFENKLQTLLNENECLKKECISLRETGSPELISKNESLKLIIEDQIDSLAKFTQGTKNLELMLGAQRGVFNKNGLGYDPFDKKACLLNERESLTN